MRTDRRFVLAPFLGGALLLHGVAGLLWPASPTSALPAQARLQATLRFSEGGPVAPIPTGSTKPNTDTVAHSSVHPETVVKRTETPLSATVQATTTPSADRLVEEARALLNRESRQRQLDPMFAPPSKVAAVESPLTRAMARPQAGEKIVGEGVLQLTTADGKVHCLQRPPDIVSRDIPGGNIAIPVTCPF